MAWKNLKTHTYYGAHGASDYGDNTNWVKFTLQYDDSSNCITELKIRFVVTPKASSYYAQNGYHIYVNPRADGKIADYDTTNNYYKPFNDGTLGEIILRAKAPAPNGSHDGFNWFGDVTVTDSTSGAVARTYLHGDSACSGGSSCPHKPSASTYCNGSHCRQGTILLKKAYDAASFTIPSYALVCPGYPQEPEIGVFKNYVDYDEHVITYKEGDLHYPGSGKALVYDYFFKKYRVNFKEYISGSDIPSTTSISKKATDITRGTVNIVDNKNKTITVSGTKPKNGNYNNLTKKELVVTFSNGTKKTETVGAWSEASPTYSYTYDLPAACPASVSATLTTAAPYTSEGSINSSLNITYSAPKAPNTLTYTTAGKNNLKPRYKDDLTWTWDIPENSDGDNTSVEGYRVIIYKNGTSPGVYGVIYKEGTPDQYKGNGVKLSKAYSGKTSYDTPYYELTTKSLTFNPKTEGFKAKDTCYCRVYTYGYGANKEKLYSDAYIQVSCLLYNSAVVWIKVNTGTDSSPKYEWKEGIPYVKTSSGWKEAEGVYVKTAEDTWSEST